jgi:hypothetical protein
LVGEDDVEELVVELVEEEDCESARSHNLKLKATTLREAIPNEEGKPILNVDQSGII